MAAELSRRVLLVGPDDTTRQGLAELFDTDTCCDGSTDVATAATLIAESDYALVVVDAGGPAAVDPVIDAVGAIPVEHRPLLFILFGETGDLPTRLDPRVVTVLLPRPRGDGIVREVLQQTIRRMLAVGGEATLRRLRDAGAVTPDVDPSGSRAVLVADDDHPLRDLIATILKREGLESDLAPDGERAIEKLGSNRYSVLILDLMMPKLSGWEVIGWLKANPERRPRTVIVNTAADRSVLSQLDPEVVNAIFVKPFDVTELGAYVRACAQLKHQRDRRKRRIIQTPG